MKMLLGIMAVIALFAVPGMAADVPVAIHVDAYCAVVEVPTVLAMTVNDVDGAPASDGLHQATGAFKVQGNKAFTAELTSQYVSNSAGAVQGGGEPVYPTAYIGGTNSDPTKGIGFGPGILDLTNGGTAGDWSGTTCKIAMSFAAGMTTGKIRINSYLNSGRTGIPLNGAFDGGQVAVPGDYTGKLILTLSIVP